MQRFITFEGGEGAGKSTQVRLLAERLRACGYEVVVTREPGGTPLAEKIRDLILSEHPQSRDSEFLLFAAARAEHLEVVIKAALLRDAFVLCDRFIDSTRVYQGDIFQVDRELIRQVESLTIVPWMPSLTIVVDVDPEIGLQRAVQRGALSRYDSARLTTHKEIRRGFLRIAAKEPERCIVVDGARAPEEVAEDIWTAVQSRLLHEAR